MPFFSLVPLLIVLAGQSNMLGPYGVGPRQSFEQAMAARGWPAETVQCAENGSALEEWLPTGRLYAACLAQLDGRRPDGLLFYQGETDAIAPGSALLGDKHPNPDGWEAGFEQAIGAWREAAGVSALPIVFAQLGQTRDPRVFTNWALVQQQQASVDLDGVAMIRTDDLELRDTVHLTDSAYDVLGQRFADAFLALHTAAPYEP